MNVLFENQFKPGDIICSGYTYGKCMIVLELVKDSYGEFRYRCEDLVKDGQLWSAKQFSSYKQTPNNWKIATDKDIVNYLTRFVTPSQQTVGYDCDVEVVEDGLNIFGPGDQYLYFNKKEARALKAYLNKWIVE